MGASISHPHSTARLVCLVFTKVVGIVLVDASELPLFRKTLVYWFVAACLPDRPRVSFCSVSVFRTPPSLCFLGPCVSCDGLLCSACGQLEGGERTLGVGSADGKTHAGFRGGGAGAEGGGSRTGREAGGCGKHRSLGKWSPN